jgi:hypothetical protein
VQPRQMVNPDDLALANELSRQVHHEFSNFVNELLLRIELWRRTPTPTLQGCDHIQNEARKITAVLGEWEKFQKYVIEEPAITDLNVLIQDFANCNQAHGVAMKPTPASEPAWVECPPTVVRNLLHLLLESSKQSSNAATNASVEISIEKASDQVEIHILGLPITKAARTGDGQASVEDTKSVWLIDATCRALAIRLDSAIRHEAKSGDRMMTVITFPLKEEVPRSGTMGTRARG